MLAPACDEARLHELSGVSQLCEELELPLEGAEQVAIEVEYLERVVGVLRPKHLQVAVEAGAEAPCVLCLEHLAALLLDQVSVAADILEVGNVISRRSCRASRSESPAGPSSQSVKAIVPPGRTIRTASATSFSLSIT